MMKKMLALVLLVSLFASPALAATDTDEITAPGASSTSYYGSADGAPMADLVVKELGVIDRIRQASDMGDGFTVVNNHLCSSHGDREWSYTPSRISITSVTYTNDNHPGEAVQLFRIDQATGGWDYIGERTLANGETGKWSVEYGENYLFVVYNCNTPESEKTCTKYESVSACQTDGTTIRERTCIENGETQTTERVVVDWWDADAPQTCGTDSGSSNDGSGSADGGSTAPSTGPAPEPGQPGACDVELIEQAWQSNVRPGDEFSGIARFEARQDASCVFSAMMSEPTASIVAEGSACDEPDPMVAEARVEVKKGETYAISFQKMQAKSEPGEYPVYVSAWTGCAKDGGQPVLEKTNHQVNVVGGAKGELLTFFGFGVAGFAVFLVLLAAIGAGIYIARK